MDGSAKLAQGDAATDAAEAKEEPALVHAPSLPLSLYRFRAKREQPETF